MPRLKGDLKRKNVLRLQLESAKAISTKAGKGANRGVSVVFGGIFAAVGAGVFVFLCVMPTLRWMNAQRWDPVECRIADSRVASHSGNKGTTYSIEVRYRYEYNGHAYDGDRYNFFSGSSSGYESKQAVVEQYPAGSTKTCYVNPGNPGESVLSRDFSWGYLIGCFGLIFLAIGVGVIVGGFRTAKKGTVPAAFGAQAYDRKKPPQEQTGSVTLKPAASPLGKFLVTLIFGVIWNGISFGILTAMILSSDAPVFAFCIIGVFCLIGVAIAALVVYTFLALFNPRVEITLSPGTPRLGADVDLSWQMTGDANRISRFAMYLVGKESATYVQGTNTHTDHSTFLKELILETSAPSDMRAGTVKLSVPEFSMHTFEARNNKITWQIRVHGDIKNWPDLSDEYILTVLPLAT